MANNNIEQLTETIKQKTKFSWFEKRAIKKQLKLLTKQIDQARNKIDNEEETRKKLINVLKELDAIFTITDDDGTILTEQKLQKKETQELIDINLEGLKALEELL